MSSRSRRFVLLAHDWPAPHFDLLVEDGAACRTWRLEHLPSSTNSVAVEPLPPHRLHYLTYEGPVSGGRGAVTRVDAGTASLHVTGSGISLELRGEQISGAFAVVGDRLQPTDQREVASETSD